MATITVLFIVLANKSGNKRNLMKCNLEIHKNKT